MRPSFLWLYAVPVAVSCSVSAAFADSESVVSGICVHVYNYAGIPASEMTRARAEAARVLTQAGIETRWVEFLADRESGARQVNPNGDYAPGSRQGPTHLNVSIYPRTMAQGFRLLAADFGFAMLPSEKEEFGTRSYVFFERVMLLTDIFGAPHTLILGHAMAHEIGHLLLGAGSHSPSGIMRAPWRGMELRKAAMGLLQFTDGEARRMRQQVRARMQGKTAEPF